MTVCLLTNVSRKVGNFYNYSSVSWKYGGPQQLVNPSRGANRQGARIPRGYFWLCPYSSQRVRHHQLLGKRLWSCQNPPGTQPGTLVLVKHLFSAVLLVRVLEPTFLMASAVKGSVTAATSRCTSHSWVKWITWWNSIIIVAGPPRTQRNTTMVQNKHEGEYWDGKFIKSDFHVLVFLLSSIFQSSSAHEVCSGWCDQSSNYAMWWQLSRFHPKLCFHCYSCC